MPDQSTTLSTTPTSSELSDIGGVPAEGPWLGAAGPAADSTEDDLQHSLSQEKRMLDFFTSDDAALAAAPAAAAAAAAAAADVIAAEAREGAASAPTGEPLVLPDPYQCNFRVFRISNPKAYYEAQSLEHRLPMLGAESIAQLCKTIASVQLCLELQAKEECYALLPRHVIIELLLHAAYPCEEDRLNSRYYFVVLQTKDKLNGERVKDLIKAENAKMGRRLGNKKLNFNFCSSFYSLTGFKRNAVCPFASKTPIPVIISRSILQLHPKTVFLGGGAPDLKVEISVLDLVRITNPIVGVVSDGC
ncbi:hypothetical protein Esti_002319 [Eimeria stiedai]